jgi:hypothetical protein
MSKPLPSWQEKDSALQKAFRKLRIQPRKDGDRIPYQSLIGDIPRQLMLMAHGPRMRVVLTKEGLRSVPLSILPAEKGLRRLAESTERTVEILDRLSETTLGALNYKPTALKELALKTRILHAAAQSASAEIAESKRAKPKAGRGRPPQVEPSQPQKIARVVAQHYRGLTGKKATRYNAEFVALLREVYKILGIKASAGSQAEALPPE